MLDDTQLHLLVMIPGALLVGAIGWAVMNPASDFRIQVRGNRVGFRGKFPAGLRWDVQSLLLEEMGIQQAVILGNWGANRVLRVSFRGPLDKLQQQRIRNYLKTALRG